MDVAAWLQDLGLERYARAFRDNDVDAGVLLRLTAEDLRELGVASIGHRRRLLDAIAALTEKAPKPTTVPTAAVTQTPPDARAPAEAERRPLTVMFCDLVGSTALSTRHDPEDLRELIGDYHRVVADAVGRFDGFFAKYMGDGVLIYFGYPQAHEDDAERAVRAGLAVIEAVGKLPAREDLRVRLGIATGLAVVGDLIGEGAAQERGVVGETPNLAARMQAVAMPNTLVIAEATLRQVGGLFEVEDLGPQALAGFSEPQPAWRIVGDSGVLSRFEALRSGTTPLVGRGEELDLLLRRWQQVKSGEGRVVLISGEPGIGKSRLTVALSEHIESKLHTRLRYFCSPHHQDSALHPFIAQLERAARFARDDTVQARLDKLRALLAAGMRDDDYIALLSELLSLPSSAADLNLSPQRKREKLFAVMLGHLAAEARRRPVLMVFEDAHWIDPTSRELLDLVVDTVRRLPVLLAITFRPEFQPPWSGRAHVTILALNRLGERDGAALVQTLAGNVALTPEMVAEIVERTDGVPLFVEELTKAVLESAAQGDRVAAVLGRASLAALSVPSTLHASLMARLDRLGPAAKEIAQIGAVLGREFAYELIEPVAQRDDRELQAAFDQLGEAGLLFCRGIAPHSSYLFKHALVQDAAYSTLLRRRRQELHARVAAALEQRFADVVERQPELLAHHLTAAGLTERAVAYWHRAGERAVERSANSEAIAQFRKALDILALLPDDPHWERAEMNIQMALGSALSTMGWAASEKELAYARARELAERLGEGARIFQALWHLGEVHASRGEPRSGYELGEECLRIATATGDPGLLLGAHHLIGELLFWLGSIVEGRRHEDRAHELYDPVRDRDLVAYYGMDPFGLSCGVAAMGRQVLGTSLQAWGICEAGLARARELSHTYSIAFTLMTGAGVRLMQRDVARTETALPELVSLCAEHNYTEMMGWAQWMSSWAAFHRTGSRDAIDRAKQALLHFDQAGGTPGAPWHKGVIAEMYASVDNLVEARSLLDEAFEASRASEQHFYDAELHRIAGQIALAAASDLAAPERSFRAAMDDARERDAKWWELRAATSLARLWGEQGRRAESRDLLAPVYGWFTEGFDTADLKEAKALLDELA